MRIQKIKKSITEKGYKRLMTYVRSDEEIKELIIVAANRQFNLPIYSYLVKLLSKLR